MRFERLTDVLVRIQSFRMCCVTEYVVHNISKDHNFFIFRVRPAILHGVLGPDWEALKTL